MLSPGVIFILFKSHIYKKNISKEFLFFGKDCILVKLSLQSLITFKTAAKLPRLWSNSNLMEALLISSSETKEFSFGGITNRGHIVLDGLNRRRDNL